MVSPSKLTDLAVRNARPSEAARKLYDAERLYLLLATSARKHWRFDYRFDGVRRTLAIGSYPLMSIAEAREEHDKARKQYRR